MGRERLTIAECMQRLESLDFQIATAVDNRVWRRLREQRRWWCKQLEQAQERENYPSFEGETSCRRQQQ